MTAKEAIEKIKQLFEDNSQAPGTTPTEEIKMTKDGKKLSMAAFKVGEKCMLIDAEVGNPVPNGSYELEDGSVMVCKDGIIESIVKPQESTEVDMTKQFSEMRESFTQTITALEARLAAMEQSLKNMQTSSDAFSEKVAEGFKLIEAIAERPSEQSNEKPKGVMFKSDEQRSKEADKLKAIADTFKNIHSN